MGSVAKKQTKHISHPDAKRGIRIPPFAVSIAAVLAAFLIGAGLIALSGASPVAAYRAMIVGAFGTRNNFGETLVKAVPLLLAGLGMAVAIRARIFNIGAEGQLYMGAVGATFVGLFVGDLHPLVGIPLTLFAGFVMGALWAGIAGWLKLQFKANEIIVTLMMNYIAIEIVSYLTGGPWRDPMATEPFTAQVSAGSRLPIILPGTRLHAGLLVALIGAAAIWWITHHTVLGYQMTVAGANEEAARYSGIKTRRLIMITMLISGGLAGLAGVSEISGLHHRLLAGFSPSYGYTAIAIAMLGGLEPIGVVLAAFLFAALVVGADGMHISMGIPVSIVLIIEGLVLFFILSSAVIRRKLTSQQ